MREQHRRKGVAALGLAGRLALTAWRRGQQLRRTRPAGRGRGRERRDAGVRRAADPVIIDGAYVSDGESLRVIRQIFEGAGHHRARARPTSSRPWPAEWTTSDDGSTWTFTLQRRA